MPYTRKQSELLAYLRKTGGVSSIYALAKALDRPYHRVLDHVRGLEAAGKISLRKGGGNARRAVTIAVRAPRGKPPLTYNRIWSVATEKVSDGAFIASVLGDPSFEDVLQLCVHYGLPRVLEVYRRMLEANEMTPTVQRIVWRMLGNIEIGFARAA